MSTSNSLRHYKEVMDLPAYEHYVMGEFAEEFMKNLDSNSPIGYSRESDIAPSDILFAWMEAASQKGGHAEAGRYRQLYIDVVKPDAMYYGLSPETLFEIHLTAIDEDTSNREC